MKDEDEKKKLDEAGFGVEYAWIPGAAAALGIGVTIIKGIVATLKEKGYKGMEGFIKAYKEVGGSAKSSIGDKMSGNM